MGVSQKTFEHVNSCEWCQCSYEAYHKFILQKSKDDIEEWCPVFGHPYKALNWEESQAQKDQKV
jgi:hypothetical protein